MRYNSKSIHTPIQTAQPLQTAHFVKMAKTTNVSVGKLHVLVTQDKLDKSSDHVVDIKPFWWWSRLIFGSSYKVMFRVSKQVIMGEDKVVIQVKLPESSVTVHARKVVNDTVDIVFRKSLGIYRRELVINSLPITVEKWFPEQSNCPVCQRDQEEGATRT